MATATDALSPNDPIDGVIFFGAKLQDDIRDQLIEASFDASVDQVAQVSFSFMDPGFVRLSSGLYAPQIPVNFEDYRMEVASVDTGERSGNERVTVKCRSRVVRQLKQAQGKKVYKNISPSQFVQRECKAIGATCVVQPSAKRKQIHRDFKKSKEYDEPASSWSTFKRLAGEIGFIMFESGNVIYFGKPSWLMAQGESNPLRVNWKAGDPDTWTLSVPECSKSTDSKSATITFRMPISRATECKVGRAVLVSGIPGFNGYYLLSNVNYELMNASEVSCVASTPDDPQPLGVAKTHIRTKASHGGIKLPSGGAGSTIMGGMDNPRRGSKSAFDFAYFALKQAGDRYIYGVEVSLSDPNPSAFDCSELVQWAAAQVGVYIPDGSSAQAAYCKQISVDTAIRTRGALLFKPGHVAISLGNGMTIEALNPSLGVRQMSATNRSFSWTSAGLIPGMNYGLSPTKTGSSSKPHIFPGGQQG